MRNLAQDLQLSREEQLDLSLNSVIWLLMRQSSVFVFKDNFSETLNFVAYTVPDGNDIWFINSPPEQNGRHFAGDIFRCIFVNAKFFILIKISLNFVQGLIDNNTALV